MAKPSDWHRRVWEEHVPRVPAGVVEDDALVSASERFNDLSRLIDEMNAEIKHLRERLEDAK